MCECGEAGDPSRAMESGAIPAPNDGLIDLDDLMRQFGLDPDEFEMDEGCDSSIEASPSCQQTGTSRPSLPPPSDVPLVVVEKGIGGGSKVRPPGQVRVRGRMRFLGWQRQG